MKDQEDERIDQGVEIGESYGYCLQSWAIDDVKHSQRNVDDVEDLSKEDCKSDEELTKDGSGLLSVEDGFDRFLACLFD